MPPLSYWRVPRGFTNLVEISAHLGLRIDGTVLSEYDLIPSGLTNIIAISADGYGRNNLALRDDGTIIAWRWDTEDTVLEAPPGLGEVVQISAGRAHSLALRKNGTVVSWGHNESGQTNVPPGLSNVVAIAAGSDQSLALRADGTVVAWGLNGQTDVPAGLSDIVAVAAGTTSLALRSDGTVVHWSSCPVPVDLPPSLSTVVAIWAFDEYAYDMALGANTAPGAFPPSYAGVENSDLAVQLSAEDPNPYDSLQFRILTLPPAGALYQVDNETRGAAITAPNTQVTDPNHRVIFAPALNAVGNPYTSFTFAVNDGELDSEPATVTLSVIEPFPRITLFKDTTFFVATDWTVSEQTFVHVAFAGSRGNTYRLWSSTNLFDWRVVDQRTDGGRGVISFGGDLVTNAPMRFYKVSTP